MRRDLTLKPIGFVESPYKQKFGTPRQGGLVPEARGRIVLNAEFCPPGCLEGLSGFSHLWVIFHFHKNTNETVSGKVKPPRLNGEKMGLFATRSPHRPNPLGMSVYKVESVDEENLMVEVSGLDVVDGTPVFDIKPYHPEADLPPNPIGGWTEKQNNSPLSVHWSVNPTNSIDSDFKTLIEKTLEQDLRNSEDKTKEDPSKVFKTLIGQYDVLFKQNENKIEIVDLILK